jgi:hypothetical protein
VKKFLLVFAVIAALTVGIGYGDIIISSQEYKTKKASEKYYAQVEPMYKNIDTIVIENTIDDKDGQLAKAGFGMADLDNAAKKALERHLSRTRLQHPLKIGILNQPYNDDTPNTILMALHWEVKELPYVSGAYNYRSVLTTKRKLDGAVKEIRQTLPGGTEIYYSKMPVKKEELQKEVEMQMGAASSSFLQGISRFN